LEDTNHQLNQHISDLFNEKYSLLETQFNYEKQLDEKDNHMNHLQSELETLVSFSVPPFFCLISCFCVLPPVFLPLFLIETTYSKGYSTTYFNTK
jgi:hypothetical protein